MSFGFQGAGDEPQGSPAGHLSAEGELRSYLVAECSKQQSRAATEADMLLPADYVDVSEVKRCKVRCQHRRGQFGSGFESSFPWGIQDDVQHAVQYVYVLSNKNICWRFK